MGSYRIVKKLATGGMSEVFLGQECGPEAPGRWVALKRLLPMYQRDAHQVEQFLREARVCQDFRHPNVVPVLEVGVSQERLYTVMELVEGESLNGVLRAQLQRNERMGLAEACDVVRQVAEGLAYAHALRGPSGEPLGLIHRDINPSNVLLSRTGEVKLVDFGIAKVADGSRDTQAGLIKGKLRYLSPEQARGERLDQRSDVFLLGVLLYELLTGRHLFHGSDLELLQQITRFDEDRLEPVPGVPQPLWRVLRRTLAASRHARMGTARELADSLSAFLEEWKMSQDPIDMAQVFARCFPEWRSPLQGPHEPCDTLVCLKSHAPPVLSEEPFSLRVDVCEEAEARTAVLSLPPLSRPHAVPVLQKEPTHALQRFYRERGPGTGASREPVLSRLGGNRALLPVLVRLAQRTAVRLGGNAKELGVASAAAQGLALASCLASLDLLADAAPEVAEVLALVMRHEALPPLIQTRPAAQAVVAATAFVLRLQHARPEPADAARALQELRRQGWLHLSLLEALASEVDGVLLQGASKAHPEKQDTSAIGLLG